MKCILVLISLLFSTIVFSKQDLKVEDVVKNAKKAGYNKNCTLDSFKLLNSDKIFADKTTKVLKKYGNLSIEDFDMGECLTSDNIDGKILVNHFWQKNKKVLNHTLDLFIAYDYKNNLLLSIILDNDLNAYIEGDVKSNLIDSLKLNPIYKNNFSGIDLTKNMSFSDLKIKHIDNQNQNQNEINQNIEQRIPDIQSIQTKSNTPQWNLSCTKDRFNGMKSCFMNLNNVMVGIINGRYSVYIGRRHYPGSYSAIKIDNEEAIYGSEGIIKQPNIVIEQMKKGKVAYSRYREWPYDYNRDGEVDLNGFTKQFNELLERYRKL